MPSFDWREFEDRPFEYRFPNDAEIEGLQIWQAWFEEGQWQHEGDGEQALNELINRLRTAYPDPPVLACPRLFISHRQCDSDPALSVAWIAYGCRFDTWLDILDPQLQSVAPTAAAANILIASIIELALLNCSHVIATLTPQTRGTLWVPYEYGRIKEPWLMSRKAACWLDTLIIQADVPEYTALGTLTRTRADIQGWLTKEARGYPNCAERSLQSPKRRPSVMFP